MKEKLVSLELAKLALKKGFDYPTYDYVWTDRDYIQRMCDSNKPSELHRQMLFTEDIDKKKRVLYTISIPTQSLLQKWLREVHKIHIVGAKTSTEFNLQNHIGKDFRILGIESCQSPFGKHAIYYHVSKNEITSTNYGFQWKMLQIVKNTFYLKLVTIIDWINQYIINPICFIPTYTELDAMPKGWKKCFGISMCKEIKASLKRSNYLYKYRIMQIKEKYGSLRWYDAGSPEEVKKIIQKYEYISERTCIICGRPATKISQGWISPYCDDCYKKYYKDQPYSVFKTWYGWTSSAIYNEIS